MQDARLIAGAMSGTSADGVDIAVVSITGRGLEMSAKLIGHHHVAFAPDLREKIFSARGEKQAIALQDLATLGRQISQTYARAVNECLIACRLSTTDITAIAAHGQTLFHNPPDTIQWLDPALLAAETGIQVVSDFRRADCAAGGQGAPLVPFADYILFRHPEKNRVLLNIGGIANLTYIPAGATIDQIIAFDTGPGNCVIDHYCRQAGIVEGFDRDGRFSEIGQADFQIAFLAIRNWKLIFHAPPKSTDVPEMVAAYADAITLMKKQDKLLEDHCASACMMTALGVDLALDKLQSKPDEIIVSGGGVRNPRLMRELAKATQTIVIPIDELGTISEAKEAIAFALLGAATLDGVPSNVPGCTGAKKAVVLGSITPKP